jgi:type IV fimbrial biogenesis protein FimT
VRSVQLSTACNAFLASLRLARSEAARRGSRVALCKSADGVACAATGGWDQGWLMFHDADGDGRPDAGEQVIQRTDALASGLVVTGNQPVARVIAFSPQGGPRGAAGGILAGTVTLCHRSADAGPARRIVIASGGRSRVQQATVASCG